MSGSAGSGSSVGRGVKDWEGKLKETIRMSRVSEVVTNSL